MDSPLRDRAAKARHEAWRKARNPEGLRFVSWAALPPEHREEHMAAMDAALSTLTLSDHIAAVEAAGLVVVPAEPTEAMKEAAGYFGTDHSPAAEFRAMLAARPR